MIEKKNVYKGLLFLFFLLLIFPVFSQDFYWEEPRFLAEQDAKFLQTAAHDNGIVVLWQEFEETGTDYIRVYISFSHTTDGRNWTNSPRVLGPFEFAGEETSIASMVISQSGSVYVAVFTNANKITIYQSDDLGNSFNTLSSTSSFTATIAPKLILRDDDSFLLLSTQERTSRDQFQNAILGISCASSRNGRSWSDFEPLVQNTDLSRNYLPSYASDGSREYIVFQSFISGRPSTYQLYLTWSDDGGDTWSEPVHLSGFEEPGYSEQKDPATYNNQRPSLLAANNRLYLAWERGYYLSANPGIYYMELSRNGSVLREPEQISSDVRTARNPRIISHEGTTYITYFDNRAGEEHLIATFSDDVFWVDDDLSRKVQGISQFGGLVKYKDNLYAIWENVYRDEHRIALLEPDKSVAPPVVQGVGFVNLQKSAEDSFNVSWTLPRDSSGIAGFSYAVSQDPDTVPPEALQVLQNNRTASFQADDDGLWYFYVRATDYAGNWSEPARIAVERDTTPPGLPVFGELEYDEEGYLLSNTQTLSWEPPGDADLAGYSFQLRYLASEQYQDDVDLLSLRPPGITIDTTAESWGFNNIDNGLYAFGIRALDSVGNAGETAWQLLRMNKYVPVTYITRLIGSKDEIGRTVLGIQGRGFNVGGVVDRIVLDRDGRLPYDYEYTPVTGKFQVLTDRVIENLVLEDIEEGNYLIGVIHPQRGVHFSPSRYSIEPTGTIKFGDYTIDLGIDWTFKSRSLFTVSFNSISFYLILLLLGAFLLFTIRRLSAVVQEGNALAVEVNALIHGTPVPSEERKKRMMLMSKHGMGLRIKFALMVTLVVLIVVVMVSMPLSIYMLDTQERTLAQGLRDKIQVLLESIASNSRTYLPSRDSFRLGFIPDQVEGIDDVLYATITGQGNEDSERFDYIWATNDPNWRDKLFIDPDEGSSGTESLDNWLAGEQLIVDDVSAIIPELQETVDSQAAVELPRINQEITEFKTQANELVTRYIQTNDQQYYDSAQELQELANELTAEVTSRLNEYANIIGSYPELNVDELSREITEYTFYKPVVYSVENEDQYFRGLVRVGVSTQRILEEIEASRRALLTRALIIAAIAVGLGIASALILATIIIIPIRKLVRGVEIIRDTEDKEELTSHSIQLNSKDELSILADTVNQMTQALVKAESAAKMLTMGKELQKRFIPLETDSNERELTTCSEQTDNLNFFGYYEGAKGVSGDYFDYLRLDDTFYSVIKCDVAGKGVPASLIMVEVATIFASFFKQWNPAKPNLKIDELVFQMNDLLEERGFKGRFAALTVALINSKTGVCYICHAGDNIVRIYRKDSNELTEIELDEAPATGIFPNIMLEMKGGFKTVPKKLNSGDALFLWTDGLDEAQRHYRDKDFNIISIGQESELEQTSADTDDLESTFEEFTVQRLQDIVQAVFARGTYVLEKQHNPVDEKLVFDFSRCSGTIEEAVTAMVSVEKVFRIYRDPKATDRDRVMIDKKIDAFLQNHFNLYGEYFRYPVENNIHPEYVYYTSLKEDDQYDDLTIIVVQKK